MKNKNPICINWDHIDQWRLLHQVTDGLSCQEHVVLLTSEQEQAKDVSDAKKTEIENMEIHKVYECVLDMDQKCMSTRWVITEKFKDNKIIMKAHLVACGYEEYLHNLKTDFLTCSREAIHLVMLTASAMKRQLANDNS